MNAKKIATSVSASQYAALERTRRRLRLRRSEAVQRALELWLASTEGDARVAQYVRGYLSHPEDEASARAYTRAWATGLDREDWT